MSAQKSKKRFTYLVSFFVFISILGVIASCSSDSPNEPGPGEQQGVSSSSSEVASSSSSEVVSSSSSEVVSSSSSEVANSSSSEVANSSSSSEITDSSSSAVSSSSGNTASSSSVAASSSSQASTPVTTRSWTSVDYAPTAPAANKHDRQRLDITLPSSGNGPFPLILYVHGGGFTSGEWQLSSNKNNGLLSSAPNKGYAIASAGYLLYKNNKASFPQMVEDILAAIRYLRANASTYHLDPNKFVIAGFSAGGYLTNIVCTLSGTTHTYDVTTLGNAGVSSNVQAAVSASGLTDFSKLVEQSGSTMHNTMAGGPLGGNLTDNTELMRNNLQKQNPLNWVSANTPPLYMRHGTSDNIVPWQQSQILYDKITSVTPNAESLDKVKFNKREGKGHEDFDNSDASAILDFLDKALGIQR